jgi:hypothetical protein
MRFKHFFIVVGFLFSVIAFPANAATKYKYDAGLAVSDFSFSVPFEKLVEGQQGKVYAKIWNFGSEDITASVVFLVNDKQIGAAQAVSLRAGGLADEVFTSFSIPEGPFSISAEIDSANPVDENPANNHVTANFITPQKDTDHDGIGNNDDLDDDNDRLLDTEEAIIGTNPLVADTDGDGVNDKDDAFPLDPKRTKLPPPVVPKPAVVTPTPVVKAPAKTTTPGEKPMVKSPVTDTETPPVVDEPIAGGNSDEHKFDLSNVFSSVQIKAEQTGWGTYDFSFTTDNDLVKPDNLKFTWDFGDSKQSGFNGVHRYATAGTYFVKLSVVGPLGNSIVDTVTVIVPFWSLQNMMVVVVGAVLLIVIVAIVLSVVIKNKNKRREK